MSGGIVVSGRVVGVEEVTRRLSVVAPQRAVLALRREVKLLGFLLERGVKLNRLAGQVLKRRTGRLARSINTKTTDTPTSSTATVGTSVSYGRIWELTGSRAFVILPKNKKALFWKGAAHPVARVLHPAQKPRPFLKPELDAMRPLIRTRLAEAMQGAAR